MEGSGLRHLLTYCEDWRVCVSPAAGSLLRSSAPTGVPERTNSCAVSCVRPLRNAGAGGLTVSPFPAIGQAHSLTSLHLLTVLGPRDHADFNRFSWQAADGMLGSWVLQSLLSEAKDQASEMPMRPECR